MAFVAYYRVSTRSQGRSGLGLEAQVEAVRAHIDATGRKLVGAFTEVESGRVNDRPQLEGAISLCRHTGSVLVIAKLDRLARNVAFITKVMESGVSFVAADYPHANKFTIQMLAVVAEFERDMISQRTKSALRAAAARGTVLGNPQLGKVRPMAVESIKRKADARAEQVRPALERLERRGVTSLRAIASELNALGVPTPRFRRWTATAVRNLRARLTPTTQE